MLFISLNDLELIGFHGYYEEERLLGNTFIINAKLGLNANDHINNLSDTVNYEQMLLIIQNSFQQPRSLLEEIIQDIEEAMQLNFPSMKSLYLSIRKRQPPMTAKVASSEVSLEKKY